MAGELREARTLADNITDEEAQLTRYLTDVYDAVFALAGNITYGADESADWNDLAMEISNALTDIERVQKDFSDCLKTIAGDIYDHTEQTTKNYEKLYYGLEEQKSNLTSWIQVFDSLEQDVADLVSDGGFSVYEPREA